jgi:hypothetical protein
MNDQDLNKSAAIVPPPDGIIAKLKHDDVAKQ